MAQQEASTSTRTVQGNSRHGGPVGGPGRSRGPETKYPPMEKEHESGARGEAQPAVWHLGQLEGRRGIPLMGNRERQAAARGEAQPAVWHLGHREVVGPRLLQWASEFGKNPGLRSGGSARR